MKHADLVAQSQILQLDRSARMEDRRQSCEERSEKNKHRRELWKKTNPHPLKHFEIIERHRHLLQQRNVLRILHAVKPVGFHAFRRFRLTWLRKNSVPKDLERYWMGHAPEEVGDLYSKLKDDVAFRQEWAERAGLGFELVHVGLQNSGGIQIVKVA